MEQKTTTHLWAYALHGSLPARYTAHPWAYALYGSLPARYTAHPWAYLIFCSCKNKILPIPGHKKTAV